MSWFPSSDLPRRCSSTSPNPCYLAYSHTEEPEQAEQRYGPSANTAYNGLPVAHDLSWENPGPHGLGLFAVPYAPEPAYVGPSSEAHQQQNSMTFSWPSEFLFSVPLTTQAQPFRKDSWSTDSCNPLSTLLPETQWDHLQPTSSTAPHETSPAHYEFSTSSCPSAVSSPYAQTDVCMPGSPQVKIENLHDSAIPQINFVPDSTPIEQLVVKPEDLFVRPPMTIEQRVQTYLGSSSKSDVGDYKPLLPRPERRRAYSSGNINLLDDRRKRGYTRAENASCSCDKCGKLFQRSYNLKAHMETHDPDRLQPYPCEYDGCDKRFVRRTDLARHEQSVHIKARDHPCPLCHNTFARRDTLRRHVDDGCPKRPEMKRRTPKARRASSTTRGPHLKHEQLSLPASPSPSYTGLARLS